MSTIQPSIQKNAFSPKRSLCCYINRSGTMQVIRVVNSVEHSVEQIIFPGQRFLFLASEHDQLEVKTNRSPLPPLVESLSCAPLICSRFSTDSYCQH